VAEKPRDAVVKFDRLRLTYWNLQRNRAVLPAIVFFLTFSCDRPTLC